MKKWSNLWETLTMIACGLLLWGWFIAREQARITPNAVMWPGWQWLQYIALAILFVIFVRRMLRIRQSIREQQQSRDFPGRFQ